MTDFNISEIFPNAPQGLNNIGFFFGAGTSMKAGYPLMATLTEKVLGAISPEDFEILDELVYRSLEINIEKSTGNPNIEIISDILESAILTIEQKNPDYLKFTEIRNLIRDNIVGFLQVESPDLSDHIRFFKALNRIFSGRPEKIWIFTSNYDLLFEIAASMAKVPLINGFVGTSLRYFNNQSFKHSTGTIEGTEFQNIKSPVFILLKLHGSLDWWKCENSFFNTENISHLSKNPQRVMVLPRKKKMTETLDPPYNDIFRYSESVIGSRCKYIVSCGYSFSDEHINETLFLPKLKQNRIRFTAFLKEETDNLSQFRNLTSFFYGTESSIKKNDRVEEFSSELWQFEKLVDLLCKHAGL